MKQFYKLILTAVILTVAIPKVIYAQAVFSINTKNLTGNITSIAEITDADIIVLDFWATWCKPCVKSIPEIIELSEKYDPGKVAFVGINEDSPRNTNKVKPFVNSMSISYPVLLDPDQEIMNELLVSSFPTLIILDKEAKILYTHEGYVSGDEYLIEEELNKILADYE